MDVVQDTIDLIVDGRAGSNVPFYPLIDRFTPQAIKGRIANEIGPINVNLNGNDKVYEKTIILPPNYIIIKDDDWVEKGDAITVNTIPYIMKVGSVFTDTVIEIRESPDEKRYKTLYDDVRGVSRLFLYMVKYYYIEEFSKKLDRLQYEHLMTSIDGIINTLEKNDVPDFMSVVSDYITEDILVDFFIKLLRYSYIPDQIDGSFVRAQLETVAEAFGNKELLDKAVREEENYITDLCKTLKLQRDNMKIYNVLIQDLSTGEKVQHTKFKKLVNLKRFVLREFDPEHTFDMLVADHKIPLIKLYMPKKKTLFKVFNKIEPPLRWRNRITDLSRKHQLDYDLPVLVMYIALEDTSMPMEFTKVADEDYLELVIQFDTSVSVYIEHATPERFIRTHVPEIPWDLERSENIIIKGEIGFNNIKVERRLLTDFVMSDRTASQYLFLNELDQPITTKKNKYYIFFTSVIGSSEHDIRASVIFKNSSKEWKRPKKTVLSWDEFDKSPDHKLDVNIHCLGDESLIESFIEIFSVLLSRYTNEKSNIKKRFTDWEDERDKLIVDDAVVERQIAKLREREPVLFGSKRYIKDCGNYPDFIDRDKIYSVIEKQEGKDVVKWYKKEKENGDEKWPVLEHEFNGRINYYICKNRDLRPYLYKNRNRGDHPVPCCRKSDQSEKKAEGKENTAYVIKRKALLRYNRIGSFEEYPTITRLFSGVNMCRYGIIMRSQIIPIDTFVRTVHFLVTGDEVHDSDAQDENHIITIRNNMKKFITVGRQSLYDYSESAVLNMINDLSNPLDSYLFTHVLEEMYDCNIFVLTDGRNERSDNIVPTIEIPRHSQYYVRTKLKPRKSIFLFKHFGSAGTAGDVDVLYPVWEPIVNVGEIRNKYVVTEPENWEWTFGGPLVAKIDEIYTQMILTYFPNGSSNTVEDITEMFKITAQYIDVFGKTQIVYIEGRPVYTTPIPPLNVPVKEDPEHREYPEETIKEIVKGKLTDPKLTKTKEGVVAVSYSLGDIRLSFPTSSRIGFQGIETSNEALKLMTERSQLENYRSLVKYSSLVKQFFLYTFSVFINGKYGDDLIDRFINEKTVVIPVDYRGIAFGEEFSTPAGLFENGRFKITSERLKRKLKYMLEITMMTNEQFVRSYMHQKVKGRFSRLYDYQQMKGQLMFEGEESVKEWLATEKSDVVLHEKGRFTKTFKPWVWSNYNYENAKPYLIQNPLVYYVKERNVMIAPRPNTSNDSFDIVGSIGLALAWRTYRFNPGSSPEFRRDIEPRNYRLVRVVDEKNVVVDDSRIEDAEFVELIEYTTSQGRQIGAMLPLI